MNCLEFRRHKLALPKELDEKHRTHLASCVGCAEFAARADELETRIEAAAQVPVPEGLADRVILRHKLKSRRRFGLLALAASLALAISLSAVRSFLPGEEVEQALIAHVAHEPESLKSTAEVPEHRLAAALAEAGGELKAPIGRVVYFNVCPMPGGGKGAHIVLVTPFGRATLLLMPERQQTARGVFNQHGMSATLLSLGRGSIGVVADSPEQLERVSQLLRKQVVWQT